MGRHAYLRGEIVKYREDFEKSILWLADWNRNDADRIKKGSVKEWIILLEHKIDEIVRMKKPAKSFDD